MANPEKFSFAIIGGQVRRGPHANSAISLPSAYPSMHVSSLPVALTPERQISTRAYSSPRVLFSSSHDIASQLMQSSYPSDLPALDQFSPPSDLAVLPPLPPPPTGTESFASKRGGSTAASEQPYSLAESILMPPPPPTPARKRARPSTASSPALPKDQPPSPSSFLSSPVTGSTRAQTRSSLASARSLYSSKPSQASNGTADAGVAHTAASSLVSSSSTTTPAGNTLMSFHTKPFRVVYVAATATPTIPPPPHVALLAALSAAAGVAAATSDSTAAANSSDPAIAASSGAPAAGSAGWFQTARRTKPNTIPATLADATSLPNGAYSQPISGKITYKKTPATSVPQVAPQQALDLSAVKPGLPEALLAAAATAGLKRKRSAYSRK